MVIIVYIECDIVKVVNIREEEWDTLILLDACRYDMFEEIAHPILGGKLEKRLSTASCTPDWIYTQLGVENGKDFSDTVYITANPFISKYLAPRRCGCHLKFKHIEPVWDWGWDDYLKTVHPKTMVKALEKFTHEDKIIMHFMQPHYPFLDGDEKIHPWDLGLTQTHEEAKLNPDSPNLMAGPWPLLRFGTLELEDVIEAYHTCLRTAIPYVQKCIEMRDGTTIITSDHGNLYKPPYEHPCGYTDAELIEVPWCII